MKSERISKILRNPNIKSLYEYYIQRPLQPKKTIKSPIREKDDHPSFNIFEGDKLRFKDFARESGDIIDFVQIMFNLSKKEAISKIESDLNLPKFNIIPRKEELFDKAIKKSKVKINVINERNGYAKWEVDWFDAFQIKRGVPQLYRFKSAKEIEVIGTSGVATRFISWKNEPLFFIDYPSGNKKMYRPYANKNMKWRCNTDRGDIFGYWLLNETEPAIIIASGPKDTMCLYSSTEIKTICLSSETAYLTTEQYWDLRRKTKNLFILFDNDLAGRKASEKWKNKFIVKDLSIYLNRKYKDVGEYYHDLRHEDFLKKNIFEAIK